MIRYSKRDGRYTFGIKSFRKIKRNGDKMQGKCKGEREAGEHRSRRNVEVIRYLEKVRKRWR